ncbi:uncharacterized protein LOC143150184 isoform X2 [Ptiloglossa arizonensis]
MKEIASEDRATVTDDTPTRLHSTWLSEVCEIHTGPEYIVRKYSFFANGTFLLLRYYYAEESCSIATYTIVARGSIEISSTSVKVPGATEAKFQLDSIRLIPFNRQVAHKFGRRLNASCGGIETKWRTYTAQLIYERRTIDVSLNTSLHDHGLNSNSFQSRLPRSRNRGTLDCLEFLGIEFTELMLLRVEKRRFDFPLNSDPTNANKTRIRVELLLGGLGQNRRSGKPVTGSQKPNRLQSAALVRADTVLGCLICRSVLRGTEYSPPLFHQTPPLPAVIDGLWLSIRCESVDEGFWSRRFLQIYSGDNRWSARWTYYADSTCSVPLYTVAVAGTYVQRSTRRKRDRSNASTFARDNIRPGKLRNPRIPDSNVYRRTLRDSKESTRGSVASVTLRGNRQEKPDITRPESNDRVTFFLANKHATVPSGTTELELRVIESRLITIDKMMSARCSITTKKSSNGRAIKNMAPKSCILRTIEAPAVLTFKARIDLDWNGDYILLLASWKDDLWEAPLRQCSETISRNYFRANTSICRSEYLQTHNQLFERRGRYWSSSNASCLLRSRSIVHPTVLLLLIRYLF